MKCWKILFFKEKIYSFGFLWLSLCIFKIIVFIQETQQETFLLFLLRCSRYFIFSVALYVFRTYTNICISFLFAFAYFILRLSFFFLFFNWKILKINKRFPFAVRVFCFVLHWNSFLAERNGSLLFEIDSNVIFTALECGLAL